MFFFATCTYRNCICSHVFHFCATNTFLEPRPTCGACRRVSHVRGRFISVLFPSSPLYFVFLYPSLETTGARFLEECKREKRNNSNTKKQKQQHQKTTAIIPLQLTLLLPLTVQRSRRTDKLTICHHRQHITTTDATILAINAARSSLPQPRYVIGPAYGEQRRRNEAVPGLQKLASRSSLIQRGPQQPRQSTEGPGG